MDIMSEEVTVKQFCLLLKKGSTLKGKNLLPLGANSFLLEKTPFQKGPGLQESEQKVTKVGSLDGKCESSFVQIIRKKNYFILHLFHPEIYRPIYKIYAHAITNTLIL